MIKHKYTVTGISTLEGYKFESVCIHEDMIKAIKMYRNHGFSVHSISMGEQVPADSECTFISRKWLS